MAPTRLNIDALPMNGGLAASRWATPNGPATPAVPTPTSARSQRPVAQQAQRENAWAPQGMNNQYQGHGIQSSSVGHLAHSAPVRQAQSGHTWNPQNMNGQFQGHGFGSFSMADAPRPAPAQQGQGWTGHAQASTTNNARQENTKPPSNNYPFAGIFGSGVSTTQESNNSVQGANATPVYFLVANNREAEADRIAWYTRNKHDHQGQSAGSSSEAAAKPSQGNGDGYFW